MKYKVGDRVRIKSIDWYNENKDKNGSIVVSDLYFFNGINKHLCGTIITITNVHRTCYEVEENDAYWTDEMIEGLVEEPVLSAPNITEGVFVPKKDMKWVIECILPDGYIFKDENGNVINATKIVLEKKKKEYPKTYKECCDVLGLNTMDNDAQGYKWELIIRLQELLIARDAYWKIAGDEMGLGKPWEPDWTDEHQVKYTIYTMGNDVIRHVGNYIHVILSFPIAEM